MLQQRHPYGTIQPLGYFSRTLTPSERNYDTTQRECLGIVWATLLLRPYLYGSRFTLRTDENALKWIMDMTTATGMLARWRLRLLELEFHVVHRPGRQHQAPYALSRLPTTGADTVTLSDEVPVFSVTRNANTNAAEVDNSEKESPINAANLRILCDDDTTPLKTSDRANPGDDPIKPEVFLTEQERDDDFKGFAATIGFPGSRFERDSKGLLWRKSKIDNAR